MPKKQAARERDAGKTRFELRFDDELYSRTKDLADRAGVSVNQLLQGTARWLVDRARLGEPYRAANGLVQEQEQAGCVWVGSTGSVLDDDERQSLAVENNCKFEDVPQMIKGDIVLLLDFTERRVVRDDV